MATTPTRQRRPWELEGPDPSLSTISTRPGSNETSRTVTTVGGGSEPTLYQQRQSTAGLFDQVAAMRTKIAKEKMLGERAAVEQGISAASGRSRRSARGGANSTALTGIAAGLQRRASASRAEAELQALNDKREKAEFVAGSYISPEDARAMVDKHLKSIQSDFESFWNDDEQGLATAMAKYAEGQSPEVQKEAMRVSRGIRDDSISVGWT